MHQVEGTSPANRPLTLQLEGASFAERYPQLEGTSLAERLLTSAHALPSPSAF